MRALTFVGLPSLAVAEGATTPNPGYNAVVWSTTLGAVVAWDGSAWHAIDAGGAGSAIPYGTLYQQQLGNYGMF